MQKYDRPIPTTGELYQHYANHQVYEVIGVSFERANISDIQNWAVIRWGKHKTTGQAIAIHELFDGIVLYDGKSQFPNHVIYKSIDTQAIWITPLDEFMAILGDEPTFYYRFNKISHNRAIQLRGCGY